MADHYGRNPYNPLLIGAIAVIVALVAFLVFRDGAGPTRQAGIESQTPITSPGTAPAIHNTPAPQGNGVQ
jgi:hypothetical protein